MTNDLLAPENISLLLNPPWSLKILETTDSTNLQAKRLAEEGAPDLTAVIADEQTGGRGRLGRSFVSTKGLGLYLSAILRPKCHVSELPFATALAAVAVRRALSKTCALSPQIKWTNDILIDEKKLCGILTELSVDGKTGNVKYLVMGIGINISYKLTDFPPDLQEKCTSLKLVNSWQPRPQIAAAVLNEISSFYSGGRFSTDIDAYRMEYMDNCITLGRKVRVLQNGKEHTGKAIDLDKDFGLIVKFDDGSVSTITSGDVSIRGIHGYT